MKYLVIVIDGAAGDKVESIGNKTSLEAANIKNIRDLAKKGEVGQVKTVPDGLSAGSDVANMSILSFDPKKYLKGRSSLEAISLGVDIADDESTFRVNLVTLEGDNFDNLIMADHSASNISSDEGKVLIEKLNKELQNEKIKFYPGVSYRNLLLYKGNIKNSDDITPPHDFLGKGIKDKLPKNDEIKNLVIKAYEILSKDNNTKANGIWIWGRGKKTDLPSLKDKYGINGSVITAVDLIKGIGIASGLKSIDVEGATGDINTNFIGKKNAVINEFKDGKDFVFIHLEAPDEAGHKGDVNEKIKSLEIIDEDVVKPLFDYLNETGDDFKILILPDHKTPISIRTHSSDPVPYLLFDSTKNLNNDILFTEDSSKDGRFFNSGEDLFSHFIND